MNKKKIINNLVPILFSFAFVYKINETKKSVVLNVVLAQVFVGSRDRYSLIVKENINSIF